MITARRFIHTNTTHGGIQDSNILAKNIIDFSINTNPFPPPDSVRNIARGVAIEQYPNIRPTRLIHSLAQHTRLAPDELLATNGTSEALLLISLVFLKEGDTVIQFAPCYGEYAHISAFMGANIHEIRMNIESKIIDISAFTSVLQQTRARVCWLCNPASPSGIAMDLAELKTLAEVCTKYKCILVIDEAYANFLSDRPATESLIADNYLILLRSMTKDYSLNALRLGYVAARKEIILSLATAQPPWSVNLVAEHAGIAALQEETYYAETWRKTLTYRKHLQEAIAAIGYRVLPSDANYFLIYDHFGNTHSTLQQKGMYVRDCLSFGLKQHIRIGTSNEDNNRHLITMLKEIADTSSEEEANQ